MLGSQASYHFLFKAYLLWFGIFFLPSAYNRWNAETMASGDAYIYQTFTFKLDSNAFLKKNPGQLCVI